MLTEDQAKTILKREVSYQTSRSGGKGGQNVNKVETKVEVIFDVAASVSLTEVQKELIFSRSPALLENPVIRISAGNARSQLENKEECQRKLISLLQKHLKKVKKRVATKPSKAAKEQKLKRKKIQSEKKNLRQKLY